MNSWWKFQRNPSGNFWKISERAPGRISEPIHEEFQKHLLEETLENVI